MKKILLIIGLISSLSLSFAEQNVIEVRSGYDVYNHVKDKDGDEDDDLFENGWNLGLEYRRGIIGGLQLGAGVEISQSNSNASGDLYYPGGIAIKFDYDNLISVPLYVTARYNFENSTEVVPFVKINLGYSFNSAKLQQDNYYDYTSKFQGASYEVEDSFYYAFGAGIEYRNFLVDLTYEINDFKINGKSYVSHDFITGETEYRDDSYKFENHKLKLSFGYQFEF